MSREDLMERAEELQKEHARYLAMDTEEFLSDEVGARLKSIHKEMLEIVKQLNTK